MSGEKRRLGAPQGPPWSHDLLADLHAGVLDQETAAELRPRVDSDPQAEEVFSALEKTSADLAALPPLTIPDDVAERVEAALREEARAHDDARNGTSVSDFPTSTTGQTAADSDGHASVGQVVNLDRARRKRRRRASWGAGLLTAAAAALGIVVFASTASNTGGAPQALPPVVPDSGPALTLRGGEVTVDQAQFSEALNSDEYGALADQQRLFGCLAANGASGKTPMGARTVTVDGRPAELLVLSTGKIGQFRLLVVGNDCGAGNPATISDSTFPR